MSPSFLPNGVGSYPRPRRHFSSRRSEIGCSATLPGVPPVLGGKFEVANLQLFHRAGYQSIVGQLHRQLQEGSAPA
jgi:hypothetical protein